MKILFDNFVEVPDGDTVWKPGQGSRQDQQTFDEGDQDDDESIDGE